MYIRSNKGHFIVINKDRPLNRRRFSVGHEFGHYILGHDSDITQAKNSHNQSKVEADNFSSSFLMPSDIIYELSKDNMTISEMATWLRVSKITVAFRCLYLGIREHEANEVKNAINKGIYIDTSNMTYGRVSQTIFEHTCKTEFQTYIV